MYYEFDFSFLLSFEYVIIDGGIKLIKDINGIIISFYIFESKNMKLMGLIFDFDGDN